MKRASNPFERHPFGLEPPSEWASLLSIPTEEFVSWWNTLPDAKPKAKPQGGKRGAKHVRCEECGITFRSGWEFNFHLYLKWLKARGEICDWSYEPQTFYFNEYYKTGAQSYKPDFYVLYPQGREAFLEVKGYMDSESATKILRYLKHYGTIPIAVVTDRPAKIGKRLIGKVDTIDYAEIEQKLGNVIPGWQ